MPTLILITQKMVFWMATLLAGAFFIGQLWAEPVGPTKVGKKRSLVQQSDPIAERFADVSTSEVPDFQKHVMPLLGRLGCNGRSCHGSFQGRGGFQLSLFGYDFKADYEALLDENTGRVDVDDVSESLILSKPSDADMHEGGKRFETDSWQYNTLVRWIESGAASEGPKIHTLESLTIEPAEIHFESDDQEVQLTATARWADGTVENVTSLCRFSTNDDAVAAIDENGRVESGLQGDTHVVVSYDRAVVPVPVTRRVQLSQPVTPPPASEHPIDQLVAIKHAKLGIVPSSLCTDAEFIRRVSLDVTGTLPAADEVRRFLSKDDPNKREQLVDDLLDAPGYAAWWATRMSDWTGNSDEQLNNALPVRNAAGRLWYEWLRVRLDDNMPYDQIVEGIVTAESRKEGESYLEYCQSMTKACQSGNEEEFTGREGMPLFWARRNFQKPEERAIGFAYAFLGIRIECAQCHKHPFDQWSKNDFDEFSKLFANINSRQNTVARDAVATRDELLAEITGGKKVDNGNLRKLIYQRAEKGNVVPFPELVYTDRTAAARQRLAKQRRNKNKNAAQPAVSVPKGYLLGQSDPITLDEDPRGKLMDWLRDPANPYFTRAIVNRVWANYFGIGIINPTDDMNLANPASNAALMDYLADGLRDHGFDLRWLHREIITSDAYARSTETNASNAHDRTNFSRHVPRRLPAEVIRDAVLLATESTVQSDKRRTNMDDMAIAAGVTQDRNRRDFALEVFGQSQRDSNCDCDRSDSPSLLQSIYLRNDFEMHQQLASKNGWVAQACRSLGVSMPARQNDVRQNANRKDQIERKADQVRVQTIERIKRFSSMNATVRENRRDKMLQAYKGVRKKLTEFGYKVPKFADLMANPDDWTLTRLSEPSGEVDSGPNTGVSESLDAVVVDAYLRTLSRYPEPDEVRIATQFVETSENVADGLSSVMWALVNTKEFIISH